MSAELRIMEQVIQAQVDSHNGRSERAKQKAADLPIYVDAGVATDIITDIMGTLDCSGSGFADKSKEFAENLEILLKKHQESDDTATQYFIKAKDQLKEESSS